MTNQAVEAVGGMVNRAWEVVVRLRREHAAVEERARVPSPGTRAALLGEADEAYARFIGAVEVYCALAQEDDRAVIAAADAELARS